MIILRQKKFSLPLDLNPREMKLNKEAYNLPTTKEDLLYANNEMQNYIKSADPDAKNFRVKDMKTGKWRKGTQKDVDRILSHKALKEQHKALIYESKLNRIKLNDN